MQAKRIFAMYWSATDTTKTIVTTLAETMAEQLGLPVAAYDFTLPAARQAVPTFDATDVVVFGVPTYAGRVPNLLLKYLDIVKGNGAAAIPVVTFGNRAFDDALSELRDILLENGFLPFAAAACSCEHSFSRTLGAGRPDAQDLAEAKAFAVRAAQAVERVAPNHPAITVDGRSKEERTYYQPQVQGGKKADIRKVKPQTKDTCNDCGLCVQVCPMGAIEADCRTVSGICNKCGACVKKCPRDAKYFDDPDYLYHKENLEQTYTRRAENRWYW